MTPEEKQKLIEQVYEKAAKYEYDYGCCPQCVLATLQETVGVSTTPRSRPCTACPGAAG